MRVLGVDPGLTRCGIGVIDGEPGRALRLVATDVIRTPAGDDIGARLLALEIEIDAWLARHQPDAVAVERVFSQHNVRTVMGTAQAGAVAIVCAARRGVPVALHTPSEVKAAVTGSGRADKQQVTEMVTRLLRLGERPRPADCADALALAICHLWRGTAQHRLAAAQAKAGARPAQAIPAQAGEPQATAGEARSAQAIPAQAGAAQARSAQQAAAPARSAQQAAAPARPAQARPAQAGEPQATAGEARSAQARPGRPAAAQQTAAARQAGRARGSASARPSLSGSAVRPSPSASSFMPASSAPLPQTAIPAGTPSAASLAAAMVSRSGRVSVRRAPGGPR